MTANSNIEEMDFAYTTEGLPTEKNVYSCTALVPPRQKNSKGAYAIIANIPNHGVANSCCPEIRMRGTATARANPFVNQRHAVS